jgi:hypothetical protein
MKFRAMIRGNRLPNEDLCHRRKASVTKHVDGEEVHPVNAQDRHQQMKFRAMIRGNRLPNEDLCHRRKASVTKHVDREEVHPIIAQGHHQQA